MLGPYIKALGLVTYFSEKNRESNDKIATGHMINSEKLFNLAGLFILYRGTTMKKEWIDDYDPQLKKDGEDNIVCISGSSSCSPNLIIALEFAFKR